MTRDEFIKLCSKCGYCSKKVATEYAGDRAEFTDKDFEDVFRYAQRIENHGSTRWRTIFGGAKTTKHYVDDFNTYPADA